MSEDDKGVVVAAAAPKLPPLRAELLEAWTARCVAKFRIAGITVGRTKVNYALECIPEDILPKIRLTPVYDAMGGVAEIIKRNSRSRSAVGLLTGHARFNIIRFRIGPLC